jgi:hypothetical protein
MGPEEKTLCDRKDEDITEHSDLFGIICASPCNSDPSCRSGTKASRPR